MAYTQIIRMKIYPKGDQMDKDSDRIITELDPVKVVVWYDYI